MTLQQTLRDQGINVETVGEILGDNARGFRTAEPYAARKVFAAPAGYGVSLQPVAGYYRTRLRSGGVNVGVRVWFGVPHDPHTGEELDRSPRWQAHCNGRYIEIDRVWPQCGGSPIDADEYDYLSGLQAWGEQVDPQGVVANPHLKADALHTPMMF